MRSVATGAAVSREDVMEIAAVQKKLASKALYQSKHRFNDLYRYVKDRNWLESARYAILKNSGANTPGVDEVRGKELPPSEWDALINQTIEELKTETFQPHPVRRVYIPKANGKLRPLGIPTIQDRMVQEVLRMILEPIYESRFLSQSNGFRPSRSTMTCVWEIQMRANESLKFFWVVEGDIKGCFDNIPHKGLMQVLRKVIKDERLLSLIWSFLKAGYVEDDILHKPNAGTPQGGIVSPLLTNAYLHEMDMHWWETYGSLPQWKKYQRRKNGLGNVYLVRYADDFVLLTNGTKSQAQALKAEFGKVLARLGLELSQEKTKITHVNDGLDFLGFHVQRREQRSKPGKRVLYVTPTKRNVKRYKDKIREVLADISADPVNKIRAVNQIVRGWGNYYRHVQSTRIRRQLDSWTFKAVWKWLHRKHGGGLGEKALYERYYSQRNRRGWRTLGYGGVFLVSMASDITFKKYWIPKGGIPHPYLTDNPSHQAIPKDEPVPQETWNGLSSQNKYAIQRQDLLMRNGAKCQRCGEEFPPEELDAHHVKAQTEGGSHKASNLMLLCRDCHAQTLSYGKRITS
jgi:group II intron reverse transcriptase/maturase